MKIHPALRVRSTTGKGRGVFTQKLLPEGTQVEASPVIVMSGKDRPLLDQTLLHDYIFEWQPEGKELGCCMALGYIPLYNHSYASNCEYMMDYEKEEILVVTVRDIPAGEELTINYNGDWNDEKPVWFEVQ